MAKKNNKTDKEKHSTKEKKSAPEKQPARGKAPRWRGRLVVAVLALIFVLISLYWVPAELNYRVTESYQITSSDTTDLHLAVLLPISGPYQTVSDPEVTWPGEWQTETIGRVNLLRLTGEIQAGETLTLEIQYKVDLAQEQTAWSGEPVVSNDLLPEDQIPADDPDVVAQAVALTVAHDAEATARQIYDQVADEPDEMDSTAIAYQLATLNRAAQIPTRVVSGYVLPDSVPFFVVQPTVGNSAGLRHWNEFFLENTWQMADASAQQVFYRQRLLGWTEGRHLALDHSNDLNALAQSLLAESSQAAWQTDPTQAMKVVGWSEAGAESLELTPSVSIKKTWDGRWTMAISVVVILVILDWMTETDHYSKKAKAQVAVYEDED
jgi:hypothetical protein